MNYEVGGIGAVNATPQNLDGSVNEEEYRRHISWLANNGIRFIQSAATTGQSMQTTLEDYRRPLEI